MQPKKKDNDDKKGAPGEADDTPVYYQPESGQPGVDRDPAPRREGEEQPDE
jgi:hypothetical protein